MCDVVWWSYHFVLRNCALNEILKSYDNVKGNSDEIM